MIPSHGAVERFEKACAALPARFRRQALSIPDCDKEESEEIRLRAGSQARIVTSRREILLRGEAVSREDLMAAMEIATNASVYRALGDLRFGFVHLEGGSRLGVCGTAVVKDGIVTGMTDVSSVCLRIASERRGVALDAAKKLLDGDRPRSTLILSPPGAGKTTFLRDLIRLYSNGEISGPVRVGLADERFEVAACRNGKPTLDVGERTDIISGCPKAEAVLMLIRTMAPQLVAVDEITCPKDAEALEAAAHCGVYLLATVHADTMEELERKPLYRRLLHMRIFSRAVEIKKENKVRKYGVISIDKNTWRDPPCGSDYLDGAERVSEASKERDDCQRFCFGP